MNDFNVYKKALVIAPNTILGRMVDKPDGTNWFSHLVYVPGTRDLNPAFQRIWDDRVGGLVLWALGIRTIGDMERVERERRRRGG